MTKGKLWRTPRPLIEVELDIHIKRAHELMDNLYYASVVEPITAGEVWNTAHEIIGHMAQAMKLSRALTMKEIIAKETQQKSTQKTAEKSTEETDKETVPETDQEQAPKTQPQQQKQATEQTNTQKETS